MAEWTVVHHLPPLDQGQLQLWRVELDRADTPLISAFSSILTSTEQEAAARRRVGQVRNQFVIGRGCLRLLLGNALDMEPRDVPVLAGIHGKPRTPDVGGQSVAYNLAHSRNLLLIALRRNGAVGVDIERIDPASDAMEIASRWFTAKEIAALAAQPDQDARSRLFFRYWTRKEAVAKADGRGLIVSLDAFDVAFDAAGPQPVSMDMLSSGAVRPCILRDLDMGTEFAGALALESADCTITQWLFPLELVL